MRLSEAIRAGAKLKPQGHCGMLVDGKTCALGAACEAVGIPIGTLSEEAFAYMEMERRWPFLRRRINESVCQHRCIKQERTIHAIYILNDSGGITREQIADWVEQFEAEEEAAS